MRIICKYLFVAIGFILSLGDAMAAPTSVNSLADDFSAKVFLEELMARRYTQALATIVDRQAFTLGVQLQLMNVSKPPPKQEKKEPEVVVDTPTDLFVGTLDPEKLIQQYGQEEEKPVIVSLLSTKRIKSVTINVGLREDLGAEVKAEVEKWLNLRIQGEFGKTGIGEVSFLKEIPTKPEKLPEPPPPKEWWDWLNQFQHLAGELLMALTILIGIILWRFTTAKSVVDKNGDSPNIKLQAEGAGLGGGGGSGDANLSGSVMSIHDQEERLRAQTEIKDVSKKLVELIPKVSTHFEHIVESWCQTGDEGKWKLVCFAEAVGRDVGRLPIPPDAMTELGRFFSQMATVHPRDKVQNLEKAYWDIVSVLNLGHEVLSQPFGYLSGVDTGIINKVLLDQNPKMKTLVSLYLPEEVRRNFVKPMSADDKFALLENASAMSEIAADELKAMDSTVMNKMKAGESTGSSVHLEMTIEKIVSTLSIIEELQMLPRLSGPGIESYKRRHATIAFLKEWPNDKLALVMSRVTTDQAVAYLRFEPNMQDRIISVSPPMTAEVITDELSLSDKMSLDDKIHSLEVLDSVLDDLVEKKEIVLADIFPDNSVVAPSNVVPIKSA